MLTNKHRKKYEWRPVERKILFTYIKNIDTNTLLQIDDDDILMKTCALNKYTQSLCNNYFWELKINQLLPGFEFPLEYDNKGKDLYLIISDIGNYFEIEETRNVDSYYYYYNSAHHDDDYSDDLDRRDISVANWSVKYSKPGLLKSMLKLGAYPDPNYINEAYDDYDIIKTLVDYINETSDIDDIHRLLPTKENILILPNFKGTNIIRLLLPFNIVDIKDLLIMIYLFRDMESLQMIIDEKIYLTQELANLGFIEDEYPFIITKKLIDNEFYPDDETMNKLPKDQKSFIKKFISK
jgi:hypothetical protein